MLNGKPQLNPAVDKEAHHADQCQGKQAKGESHSSSPSNSPTTCKARESVLIHIPHFNVSPDSVMRTSPRPPIVRASSDMWPVSLFIAASVSIFCPHHSVLILAQ